MFWYHTFYQKEVDNLIKNGLVIIICGKRVYDFTEYLNNHIHPGGNNLIERLYNLGNDCSKDYKFHNKKARNVWNKYFIGYLETQPSK
jgi:cytochrome b involved in lipid metabolism